MAKKETDRHVDVPQVSFTFLAEIPVLDKAKAIAKKKERTTGSIVREALRLYVDSKTADVEATQ